MLKKGTIFEFIRHSEMAKMPLNLELFFVQWNGGRKQLVPPCKGTQIPESWKFGSLGFGIRHTAKGIRNITND